MNPVVSSPLRRCRETAAPTAQALGVEIEIDPGVGEIPTPKGLSAAERPGWLLQVTNDAWFGHLSGPQQHFAQGRLRAIEPGFVQSRVQEELLHELETNLLIRAPDL